MARNYYRNIQRRPVQHRSLSDDEDEAIQIEGGEREGQWREAVPFRMESSTINQLHAAKLNTQPIQTSVQSEHPIQRNFNFSDILLTEEGKRKKAEEEEKNKIKKQLNDNIPDVIYPFGIAHYFSIKNTIDYSDLNKVKARNKYLKEQYGKIQFYLSVKKEYLPEWFSEQYLKKLVQESTYILEETNRPFSLSCNLPTILLNNNVYELVDEVLKINSWIERNPDHQDVEKYFSIEIKISTILDLYKQKPVQNAIDLKYDRRYFIAKNELKKSDLALLLYGDENQSKLLTNFDGSDLGENLYPGSLIFYPANIPHSHIGQSSASQGQIIRSNGEIDQPITSEVLEIRLSKDTYRIPAHMFKTFAKYRLDTCKKNMHVWGVEGINDTIKIYNKHKSETNSLVRGISQLGTSDFDKNKANGYIKETKNKLSLLDKLDAENLTVEQLIMFDEMTSETKDFGKNVENDLMRYINGGISGAETAVKVLNVVKEVGETAAGFIPGVGIVSGLAFDTVSQISELGFGVSDKWDFKRTATQGALSILNKAGGKLLDKAPGMEKLASKGLAGQFGKELAQGILLSPAQTITQNLIQKGDVSMDEIIDGLKENFSAKSLVSTAAGIGVNARGNRTKMGLGKNTKDKAFGSKALANQNSKDMLDGGYEATKKGVKNISKLITNKPKPKHNDPELTDAASHAANSFAPDANDSHKVNVNSIENGSSTKPESTLHSSMPDSGRLIADPLHYVTGKKDLQARLDAEIRFIEGELTKLESQKNTKLLASDKKDLKTKLNIAKKAYKKLKNKHDRTTVEDAQNALKDIRDMKLYREGKEVVLYDIPEGASYLNKDGSPITTESDGKRVLEEVFNSDPQREVGLWRDNSTEPPSYFVIQGSSFNVKFNAHGHFDLIHHTHPTDGHSVLSSLASIGDFNHLIAGKSPEKPQYLESKISTHKNKQLLESSFIAESNGNGKWIFSIKYTRPDGTFNIIKITPSIILKNKIKQYDEIMYKIEQRERESMAHSVSESFDLPTKEYKKIKKDKKNPPTDKNDQEHTRDSDDNLKHMEIDDVAAMTDRDIMQKIEEKGGNWDHAIDTFSSMPQGKEMVARLQKIREKIVADLSDFGAELLGNASTELKSDMDFNIKGLGAGRKLLFLDQKLRKKYGNNYEKALKITLFTHAGRLTHYTGLKQSKNFAKVEARITSHSETLNLARMYHHAKGNPLELARVEKMMSGKSKDEILAWEAQLGANSRQQHEKLLLEVDHLESQHNKTKDPALKAQLSEQITQKQMEANFFNPEAYIAPGTMLPGAGKTAAERRQTVMSQIEMITHKIGEYQRSNGDVSKEYEVYKYLDRVHDELVASGIEIDPKLKTIFTLAEGIYRGDRAFYDLKSRSKESRESTLYSALDAIHDILPNIKENDPNNSIRHDQPDVQAASNNQTGRENPLEHSNKPKSSWDDDKTPPTGIKIPPKTASGIKSDREAGTLYRDADLSNPRFQFEGRLDDDGVLTMTARTQDEVTGKRSAVIKGKEQYDKAMSYFKDKVIKIKGSWQYGSNLEEFKSNIAKGMSNEDAALNTWSGRMAAKYGFTKIEKITIHYDNNGDIADVKVVFVKG